MKESVRNISLDSFLYKQIDLFKISLFVLYSSELISVKFIGNSHIPKYWLFCLLVLFLLLFIYWINSTKVLYNQNIYIYSSLELSYKVELEFLEPV